MKKIKFKTKLVWTLFISIIAIMSLMLIYAINYNSDNNETIIDESILNSPMFKIVIVLLLVLAVLFVILALIFAFKNNKEKVITAKIDGGNINNFKNPNLSNNSHEEIKEIEEDKERFCMLSEIDRKKEKYTNVNYDSGITLDKLCIDFRSYASSELKLYYSISDIRKFIAGMSVSHMLILQGMSGTGKTSLAHAFGSFVDNSSTVIPVQPMWKERTDLIGYYNEFTKRFNETLLLEKMYEANYSKNIYVTVLDEMNIARVEYYFAEFLSLLELPNPEERYLDVVSDKWSTDPKELKDGRIKLPENMWFIGTANNDDSTFAISDKVYDRAMILNLDNKCEKFIAPKVGKIHISSEQFKKLIEKAQEEYEISARNVKRLESLDRYLINHFHITFGNRIMKQIKTYIPVFLACGGEELEALDDILAKKVMRKLESQNPIYLKNSVEGLIACLDELFGKDKMQACKEYIYRLERSA